ncbi:hypothetical protein VOLCADRAFT_118057 [Volvox carteri f. nagariensis]|uniref:Uncharacterized protein n=1 Tax=Volvox carteri f. nagariensis TaxID=3068 RepID=D8U0W9_VOLCA|nr:uncharacterized protein VOLCADRAFT_118057 [Volvox carteri f. nagariensis]EFJ46711.1 hypothetical protein VOLCADRAFT_118057 [Volvox carteri f. nagariensis]|eukprot:XP_002952240.1 hypothetical protein VOLCADRAFT_118057 [Volvox carteri f. nagariensis]
MAGAGGETLPGMGDTGDFVVGERVFVPHVDRHYEAKILKAEFKRNVDWPEGQWYYFLHYSGWNKKYDEWVEATGLVKAAELGMVTGAIGANGGGAKGGAGAAKKMPKERFAAATGGGGGKKGAARLAADLGAIGGAVVGGASSAAATGGGDTGAAAGGAAAHRGLQLELDISPVLKKALLDDYDAIVTDARLVPLPRSPSVAEVLRRYCEQATELGGSGAVEMEVATGLRAYFDKALMAVLLYRSERPQAMVMLSDGRLPSSVYGTEHLLRLFVKLPDLLAAAGAGSMNEDMLVQTATAVQDLMNWVAEHLDSLLAPRETYLDHFEFMAGLTGEVAEQVAAAGFMGTNMASYRRN